MSDFLKQGQDLLSKVSGGATGGGQSGDNNQASGNQTAAEGFAAKGVNAVEAQLGFDKDHKYDKYEQQGIDAIQKKLQK